ncbi:unnamed protein product, partial [Symbiodinium microadriaticum]
MHSKVIPCLRHRARSLQKASIQHQEPCSCCGRCAAAPARLPSLREAFFINGRPAASCPRRSGSGSFFRRNSSNHCSVKRMLRWWTGSTFRFGPWAAVAPRS